MPMPTTADSLWALIEQQRRLTTELNELDTRRAELVRGLTEVEKGIETMRERVIAETQAEYWAQKGWST